MCMVLSCGCWYCFIMQEYHRGRLEVKVKSASVIPFSSHYYYYYYYYYYYHYPEEEDDPSTG